MKIVFANPPVIRYKTESPKGDPRIRRGQIYAVCCGIKPLRWAMKLTGIGRLLNEGMRYGVRAGSRWPWTVMAPLLKGCPYPFLMGKGASLLRAKGFNADIIDYPARGAYSYKQFLKEVQDSGADIVVLECSTPTVDIDVWMAEEISRFAEVALAGPHISANAEKMRQEYPFVTYWLKGEYVLSSLQMAQSRAPGIYESEVITDLDAFPFPFRDYKGGHNYYDPTMPTAEPQLQIQASKGCPFHCTFCLWPQTMYNRKTTFRSTEKVIEEIKENVERFGYKSIFFDDDTFNVGDERISVLCDGLKELGLPWTMMGRLDCSPQWLFDKMVDSGCVGMRFGVESFDENVLKSIKKGIERVDFLKTLRYLSDTYPDLLLHLTMMRDMPSQTEESHARDMKFLKDMGFTTDDMRRSYQLSHCAPFPGTEMYYDLMKSQGSEIIDDFSGYDGGQETVMGKIKEGEV